MTAADPWNVAGGPTFWAAGIIGKSILRRLPLGLGNGQAFVIIPLVLSHRARPVHLKALEPTLS